MDRRLTWLAGALTVLLAAVPTASATASAPSAKSSTQPAVLAAATSDPDAEAALRRLRADADGAVSVHRDDEGDIDFVRSTDGSAMVDARSRTTRCPHCDRPARALRGRLRDRR